MADSPGSPEASPPWAEPLRRAVQMGDVAGVRTLLDEHPDARARVDDPLFPFDAPALVWAAGRGDLAMVETLLEAGADPNRRSDWWAGGFHALHSATGAVAERLLTAGAVPDACAAAHLDRFDLLTAMLDTDPGRVHSRGGDGQTPLHFARSRAVVDLLLERGADPDARDVDHRSTPAQWMLGAERDVDRRDLAFHLVERGAEADVFLAAALGLTDRLRAIVAEDPAVLELRTGQGAYGEQPPSSFHIYTWTIGQNLTPLQAAERFGQTEAFELLRDLAGPRVRFMAACTAGRADEARRLLSEHPTLVDDLTEADRRALPDAAWNGDAEAVALMLELGFDPTVGSSANGGTVLHCAAWVGSVGCAEAALRHDAVRALIDRRDPSWQSTPLGWCCHGASRCGDPRADHPAVALLLLEAGATVPPDLEAPEAVMAVVRRFG